MNPIERWRKYFSSNYSVDYKFKTYNLNFHTLFRGRKFENADLLYVCKELQHVKKMLNPPRSNTTKQRCSIKGESLLYLSSHQYAIPFELDSQKNDIISIIEYNQINSFKDIPIIGWADLKHIPNDGFSDVIKNHFKDSSKKVKLIDEKITSFFKTPKKSIQSFDIYDITIGLSQLYFQSSEGIIYPSVQSNYKSLNIAYKPQKIKNILTPVNIKIYKIIKLNPSHSVVWKLLSIGHIFKDGRISWEKIHTDNLYRHE